TPSASKETCSCAASAGNGSSSLVMVPASAASVSASARACAASSDRRAACETKKLTIAATATKMTSAKMFSASEIVHVCMGGVKYQLARRKLSTAATSEGGNPPSAATTTTTSKNASRSLGSRRWSRKVTSAATINHGPMMAVAHAAVMRRGEMR